MRGPWRSIVGSRTFRSRPFANVVGRVRRKDAVHATGEDPLARVPPVTPPALQLRNLAAFELIASRALERDVLSAMKFMPSPRLRPASVQLQGETRRSSLSRLVEMDIMTGRGF